MPEATETVIPMEATKPESASMNSDIGRAEIRVRGRSAWVPSAKVDGRTVVVTSKWLRIAEVKDEDLCEGQTVPDVGSFLSKLRRSRLNADLFTFGQRIPDAEKRYNFHTEWDNAAALAITTYDHWWKECTEYSVRKAVNKAMRSGVVARVAEFNDDFVSAVCRMYAESPVRQGRAFWHYGKDFQTIKRELATYLDRSVFLGAYYENELIGSMKFTYVDSTAPIMQIFCSHRHFDKRPNNALIAKAVEVCERDGKSHLIYGSFVYNALDTSLTEFKRRNGFTPVPLPRYYVPLTLKGSIALKLGLHRGLASCLPPSLLKRLRDARNAWYSRKVNHA